MRRRTQFSAVPKTGLNHHMATDVTQTASSNTAFAHYPLSRGEVESAATLAHNGVRSSDPDMTAISLENTFILSKEAMLRDLDGEAVILDLESGTYFGLNAVGTRMWQLIERHGRLKAVFDDMCQEYEVAPDELERDLLGLVARLAEARLGQVK